MYKDIAKKIKEKNQNGFLFNLSTLLRGTTSPLSSLEEVQPYSCFCFYFLRGTTC
jgi:hypothetical protein